MKNCLDASVGREASAQCAESIRGFAAHQELTYESLHKKPTDETYRNFLKQYLPVLQHFLTAEKILDRSFFHLSDEPSGDEHLNNYRKARTLLKELAPWMKVMDALSEVRYGKMGLTDTPIPILSSAQDYIDARIPHWVYYCTAPRGNYLNRNKGLQICWHCPKLWTNS